LDAPVAAALSPSLARLAIAVTGVTGPAGVRDRLILAEAGELPEGDAYALGVDLDVLAGLLAGR